MAGSIRRAAALAAVVSILPLTAAAQVRPRPMSTQAPPSRSAPPVARESVSTWYGELQGLSNHLQRVLDQAVRDPSLAQAREQLMLAIQRAMHAADPELPRLAARLQRIQEEIAVARQRGDTDRIPTLERELAQLQARFVRVRSDVLRQPAIARQAHAYEQRLMQRMIQIEPLTEALLARSGELQRLIQDALPQRRND